jgi:pimeloyl-[acyl-carrier protein] methyl ester esterase
MAKSLALSTVAPSNLLNNSVIEDKIPVILLHGWGLNSGVWQPLITRLNEDKKSDYCFIATDLPGFGNNHNVDITPYSLEKICEYLAATIKKPAIYLGWSLGGLVATQMTTQHPEKVLALITVASSPMFVEQSQQDWPGIKSKVLANFYQQLAEDTEKTVRGFLKIQAMGSPHIRDDLRLITELVMLHDLPKKDVLANSLTLLSHSDLRQQLATITQPFLRLYGKNDSLVPCKVTDKIRVLAPNSEEFIFEQASHAPFISHLEPFYQQLITWLNKTVNREF